MTPGERFVEAVRALFMLAFAALLFVTLASPILALVGWLVFG